MGERYPQHASYIDHWIKPLKDDKREIFRAAADAQRIVDMVLAFHQDYAARIIDTPVRGTVKECLPQFRPS